MVSINGQCYALCAAMYFSVLRWRTPFRGRDFILFFKVLRDKLTFFVKKTKKEIAKKQRSEIDRHANREGCNYMRVVSKGYILILR